MRTTILASVLALVAAGAPACAADLPVKARPLPPVFSWAGFYAGINGGYGWGDPSATFAPSTVPLGPTSVLLGAAPPFTLNTAPKGFVAGGQLGYNWQFGHVVAGIEGDFDYAHLRDHADGSFVNSLLVVEDLGQAIAKTSLDSRMDWFATLRGRLGYAFDRFLPYLTAGGAAARMKSTVSVSGYEIDAGVLVSGPFANTATVSNTRTGFAFGGGLDWAMTTRLVLRAEYLLLRFPGNKTYGALIPGLASLQPDMDRVQIARLALNYRFNP